MKKLFVKFVVVLVLFSSCKKDKIIELKLEGNITGTVSTLNEKGYSIEDRANVYIELEGSDPLISAVSNSSGYFELNNIPTGTYNIIVSKEGFGTREYQGLMVVGGDETLNYNLAIREYSKTTIENLEFYLGVNSEIYATGIVKHNFTRTDIEINEPRIKFFIHSEANPSDTNYLLSFDYPIQVESGSIFEMVIPARHLIPEDTNYLIAYGKNGNWYSYTDYFDIPTGKFVHTSLGKASNIANIIVP